MKDRVVLSIDGNCGCALLGEDLQVGESEFVEVVKRPDEHITEAERRACTQAYNALCDRLGRRLPYVWLNGQPGMAG